MTEGHCCSGQWAEIRLADYVPPAYTVENVHLSFNLAAETTTVLSRLTVRANGAGSEPFVLNGRDLTLRSVYLNGAALPAERLIIENDKLILSNLPETFVLEVETEIHPAANTALEGLYASAGMLCTQCESEGFRRITYYPDRPDVLSVFTTTLIADRNDFRVLLSNGDLIDSGELPDGKHFATWHDPYRKPSYLFALVAGNLACSTDTFTTGSGRKVDLRIYVREADLPRTGYAMGALKRSMRWDEERFGREYDLDTFMIVAVDDFNAGAMENKGLNIFNASCVLADGASATDDDFQGIERVVAHEYFHNWTGNRITCRDWFQLSLKEGLTIYRDAEFSADMSCRAVKRISDVRYLRMIQFAEDGGPLSHPVRPASYIEIGNFYTTTVYRKGAEVVRMLASLLGEEAFRTAMDLYFDRHDGEAVTIEDYVRCMEEAGGLDLTQFMRWYTQSGTPIVHASGHYDEADSTYRLTLRQELPPTPGQPEKEPFLIPVSLGLLDSRGRELHLRLAGEETHSGTSRVLHLREREQSFVFQDVHERPVPSLFRGFSAPVKVEFPYLAEELDFLLAHDTDPFNRWEAAQKLSTHLILHSAGDGSVPDQKGVALFADALAEVLADPAADPGFVAEVLILPAEEVLADMMPIADPAAIHAAREGVRRALAERLEEDFVRIARTESAEPYCPEDGRAGERRLRAVAMGYLAVLDRQEYVELFYNKFIAADNMTDTMAALGALNMRHSRQRIEALTSFLQKWRHNRQVVDKWFALQAGAPMPETVVEVARLLEHPDFEITNPNRVRALIGTFCMRNHHRFHDKEGKGYMLLADLVLQLNGLNAQLAARLLPPLTRWRRYDIDRQLAMKEQLQRILAAPALSRDVFEVVSKSLAVQEPVAEVRDDQETEMAGGDLQPAPIATVTA